MAFCVLFKFPEIFEKVQTLYSISYLRFRVSGRVISHFYMFIYHPFEETFTITSAILHIVIAV